MFDKKLIHYVHKGEIVNARVLMVISYRGQIEEGKNQTEGTQIVNCNKNMG